MRDEGEENRRCGGKAYDGSGKGPRTWVVGHGKVPRTDVHYPVGSVSDGCHGNLAAPLPWLQESPSIEI